MANKKKHDAVEALWAGRFEEAEAAGLRGVACTAPGCQAEDYWIEGDNRDEKRARKYVANHKKHSRI